MLLKQSTAATRVFALSAIGLTVNIQLSKNGGALANPAAGASNLTEIGRGLYKFTLGTTDVDTLGNLSFALTDAATNLTLYTPPDSQDNIVVDLPGATISGDISIGSLAISKGVAITNSTANGAGLSIVGNGTGHGLDITGGNGATGNGLNIAAASTNGVGMNVAGIGTGAGIVSTGGATGHGVSFVGGATSGDGLNSAAALSGHGVSFVGVGTTKHGINAAGGSTTSHGINATGGGVGHGILATSGGGATGDGIKAIAASTNGNGMNLAGVGTGAGALTTGGATGNGAKLVGGSGSGDALLTATTSGHAFNLACTGANKHPIAGVVEASYDITQCLQLIVAATAGKCSISGDTVTYRDLNDTANRIVGTTDGDGQRSAVTLVVA